MKKLFVVLVALTLFMACEAPEQDQNQVLTYRGTPIELGTAPFVHENSLAKDEGKDPVVIAPSSAETTVYGLISEPEVYLAEGGEALPIGTWVGSLDGEPVEVSVKSEVTITFETLSTVTIIQADNMNYINANGDSIVFSGSGVITASALSTGADGSVMFITNVQFEIGQEGTDNL